MDLELFLATNLPDCIALSHTKLKEGVIEVTSRPRPWPLNTQVADKVFTRGRPSAYIPQSDSALNPTRVRFTYCVENAASPIFEVDEQMHKQRKEHVVCRLEHIRKSMVNITKEACRLQVRCHIARCVRPYRSIRAGWPISGRSCEFVGAAKE